MNQLLMISSDPESKRKSLEILSRGDFECTQVGDYLDGVKMVSSKMFDAVIIDEELSDISGFKACPKIRQLTNLPIILLGEQSSEEVWKKVEEIGFDLYLKKPFGSRELEAYVKSLLRRAPHRDKIRPIKKDKLGDIQVNSSVSAGAPLPLVIQPPVVSEAIMNKKMGAVTLFYFAAGQEIKEHTALFDVLAYILDGEAEITIAGNTSLIRKDERVIMPANQTHEMKAVKKSKILLVMIKS
jgi:quercetin dioxygenase-like cupin family protein/ActR/RegA family two-component response regulator